MEKIRSEFGATLHRDVSSVWLRIEGGILLHQEREHVGKF